MSPPPSLAGPVIVIFGTAVQHDGASSGLHHRIQAAVRFGLTQPDATYLPIGGSAGHTPSQAMVMAQLLQEAGVPRSQIVTEETGSTTLAAVRSVTRCLRGFGHVGPVYVASSAYHLPRCIVLLLLAGVDAWACPVPEAPALQIFRRRWYWRLRETVLLPINAGAALFWRLSQPNSLRVTTIAAEAQQPHG